MCGIVGYLGDRNTVQVLLDGLSRLEYRGYDSAGMALNRGNELVVEKSVGRVVELRSRVDGLEGMPGIAHTRWATHGRVTRENAHPHLDRDGRIAVIHNGIIDNAPVLRQRLESEGFEFHSETDTEVIPHLIHRYYKGDPVQALQEALKHVRGTWGLAVTFADHPEIVLTARNGSPLVIGLGDGETFLASDSHALIKYTRRVIILDDGEFAVLQRDGVETYQLRGGETANHDILQLEDNYGTEGKGDFPHYMLKEIHEQPESVDRCLRGRVHEEAGTARLGGFDLDPRELNQTSRVCFLGAGTSFHAGMVGAMALEGLARVPANAEIASEFCARNPIVDPDAIYLAVSQSGETYDTLAAVKEIKVKGGRVLGVVNVVGSSIARTCGAGVYIHSGPEIAVASTKAFTSQVAALYLFTLMLARSRTLSPYQGRDLARGLLEISSQIDSLLKDLGSPGQGPIAEATQHLIGARYALFMGRGPSWPVALEGALKLKEIAYIPCEAYAAGEMKHGPIAMMEPGTPVVAVVPDDELRTATLSNVEEVRARGATIILVHTAGDQRAAELADVSIPVPRTTPMLSPLVTVVPLQLLAYQAALALGRDIDRPRNLAKSVTVA